MPNNKTDRGIQLLRIASCFAVFLCHLGQHLHFIQLPKNLYNFSQSGKYGVELFFVLSGYLVCFSLSKEKSIVQFYTKRMIRILPLYYFCILYYFITETFIWKSVPEDTMHLGWLRYIFCLNGIVPSGTSFWKNIGITWTIPVFVMFYLLAPFIVRLAKTTFRSAIVLIIAIIVSFIVQAKLQGWFSAFTYFPCFLLGIVVYNAKQENRKYITVLGFQLLIFMTQFCEWKGYFLRAAQLSKFVTVSAIFATIILVSDEIVFNNTAVTKIVNLLDEYSYTIYLVHGITFLGIIAKFEPSAFENTSTAILFRLSIAIIGTLLLSILIHRLYEKPIQKQLSNWLLKRVCQGPADC